MSTTASSLLDQALALAPEERASLASNLLASLDEDDSDPEEIERLWSAETERRMAMLESGEARTYTRDEVRVGLATLRTQHRPG